LATGKKSGHTDEEWKKRDHYGRYGSYSSPAGNISVENIEDSRCHD
jgi:hypothetical protein